MRRADRYETLARESAIAAGFDIPGGDAEAQAADPRRESYADEW